jgi:hypothetical protein
VLLCVPLAAYAGAAPGAEPTEEIVAGRIDRPAAGEVVYAGDLVEVRWTALPDTVNECELLLSLDGGREFSVRLTPQLGRTTRELSWRVPNLPALRARLRLRVGIDGQEIESSASSGFTIVGASGSLLAPLRFAHGEWWTTPVPGASQAEVPTRENRLGPAPEQHGEAILALLPEEPVPLAPCAAITVLERPQSRPAGDMRPTHELALHPVAPPLRE